MYTQLNKQAVWDENYVLNDGEPGYDTKGRVLKIGDGKTPWKDLYPATSLSTDSNYNEVVEPTKSDLDFKHETAIAAIYLGGEEVLLHAGEEVLLETEDKMMQNNIKVVVANFPVWDGKCIVEDIEEVVQ